MMTEAKTTYTGTPGGGSQTHSPVVRFAYICSFVRGSIISTHSILLGTENITFSKVQKYHWSKIRYWVNECDGCQSGKVDETSLLMLDYWQKLINSRWELPNPIRSNKWGLRKKIVLNVLIIHSIEIGQNWAIIEKNNAKQRNLEVSYQLIDILRKSVRLICG